MNAHALKPPLLQRLLVFRGNSVAGTRVLSAGLALGSLLILWSVLSFQVHPWVPSPVATAIEIGALLGDAGFWHDFWVTMGRIVASFLGASLLGAAIGVLIGLNTRAEAFFQPLLALGLAVPDPVYIIFAILAFGTGETAGFVALTVAVTPFIANIVRSSVQARDTDLDEMAQIYRLSPRVRLKDCLLPQIVPALLTSLKFAFALSWKLVVVVEAIGQPDGIGAAIFESFRLLRMREVFALAIIFVVVMQVLERGLLGRLQSRLLRWRR